MKNKHQSTQPPRTATSLQTLCKACILQRLVIAECGCSKNMQTVYLILQITKHIFTCAWKEYESKRETLKLPGKDCNGFSTVNLERVEKPKSFQTTVEGTTQLFILSLLLPLSTKGFQFLFFFSIGLCDGRSNHRHTDPLLSFRRQDVSSVGLEKGKLRSILSIIPRWRPFSSRFVD